MLQELFPATANFSEDIRTMVESHMLERNKYCNKFPTIESKDHDPVSNMYGINELSYDWEHGHRLLTPSGVTNTLFNKERVKRTDSSVATGLSDIDDNRETIRQIAIREVKGNTKLSNNLEKDIQLYDASTATSYDASTYAIRRFSKPYKFTIEINF